MSENVESPHLHSAVPILEVGDLDQALAFYRDVLGFQLAWTWDDPVLASVCHGEVQIMLAKNAHASPSRLYVEMSNIDQYCEKISGLGARISVPLQDRVYGMRDLGLLDPDGNNLTFGQAIEG